LYSWNYALNPALHSNWLKKLTGPVEEECASVVVYLSL
jgi:hypothetical protein